MSSYNELVENTERQYAFIDETGNYGFSFNKPGVSSHFIIAAIVVEESRLKSLEIEIEEVRQQFFQSGEMKSSSIGKNHKRRIALLKRLSLIDFTAYCVVVDKKRIFEDSGLRYKDPFIKYLNGRLHKELHSSFPKLQMVADQHGRKEFMDGFIKYVNSKHQPNLFEEYEFGFVKSDNNVLVQLADIIAGTLSYRFEETRERSLYDDYRSVIEAKVVTTL